PLLHFTLYKLCVTLSQGRALDVRFRARLCHVRASGLPEREHNEEKSKVSSGSEYQERIFRPWHENCLVN
ncbi:MAG: hypothetical protein P8R38_06640, partial [Planctomycetota bacterium]|nr:hypothetical protein [Planctomycetota bacterium]